MTKTSDPKTKTPEQIEAKRKARREERQKKKEKINSVKKEKRMAVTRTEKNLKIRAKKKLENEAKQKKLMEDVPKTIFVGRMSDNVTEDILKKTFGKYGKIKEIRVMWKDVEKRVHNGCAWIVFQKVESANDSLALNGTDLNGRKIRVNLETHKEINANSELTVFVKNLSFKTTEDAVQKFFEKCGKVTRISFPIHADSGLAKGVCFIDFAEKSGVEAALKLNGTQLDGRNLSVLSHNKKEHKE